MRTEKEKKDKGLCCVDGGREEKKNQEKRKKIRVSEEGKGISTESSVKVI